MQRMFPFTLLPGGNPHWGTMRRPGGFPSGKRYMLCMT